MRLLSLAGSVLRLALGRLTASPGASLAMIAGVALATAALAGSFAASLVAEDRTLSAEFDQLPPQRRVVQVLHAGAPVGATAEAEVDATAQRTLAELTRERVARTVVFRTVRSGRSRFVFTAVDRPREQMTLVDGRWPERCRPARCEVVLVNGRGRRLPRLDPPFIAVGRAMVDTLVFGELLSGAAAPSGEQLGREEAPAVVVAMGVRQLSTLPWLESIYRTYGWTAALAGEHVHPWSVRAWAERVARGRLALEAAADAFSIATPAEELLAAAERSDTAASHVRLLGGQAALLVLAFALFVAATQRPAEREADARLRWMGARTWQLVAVAGGRGALVAFVGAAAGWAIAACATAGAARGAGLDPTAVVRHSVFSVDALSAGAALALAAAVALAAVSSVPRPSAGGRRFSVLDAAAAAALLALLLEGGFTGDGPRSPTVLIVLPALVFVVAAVAALRTVIPLLRLATPLLRRGPFALRLAALSLVRVEGPAGAATAFLTVSIAAAVFAAAYGATLARAAADQASFAVPEDVLVREKLGRGGLVPVFEAAPPTRFAALPGVVQSIPIVRLQGSVGHLVGHTRVTLLGIPAAAIADLDAWRSDFAAGSPQALARALAPKTRPRVEGLVMPRRAVAVELPVRTTGDDVALALVEVGTSGTPLRIELGRTRGSRETVLRARLPSAAARGRVVGFELRRVAGVEAHALSGAPSLRGTLRLGPLRAVDARGSTSVIEQSYARWTGVGGASRSQTFAASVDYSVNEASNSQFRIRQPSDDSPLAAAVDSALQSVIDRGDVLSVRVAAGVIDMRVAAFVHRFPTIADGNAIVVDQETVSAALDTLRLGAGTPNELWLGAASAGDATRLETALRRPPFDVLEIAARERIYRTIDRDPTARTTLAAVTATAGGACILTLVAVAVFLAAYRRDEGLSDLEAQGATAADLRLHVRLRLAAVAVPGLALGCAAGIALAAIAVEFVEVTAGGLAAEPPIVLHLAWPVLAANAAAIVGGLAAVGLALTRRAFGTADTGGASQ